MSDNIFFKRKSKRSYLEKPIPTEILNKIKEIIRWSPSCANKQPWRFVFVQNEPTREKFNAALAQGNEWAFKAPLLVALCAKEADDYSRDDDPVKYYQFDSGMACLSLLLGATHEGLMAHPMAGYDSKAVKDALSIPDEYHVQCVISVGYEGILDMLDDRTKAKDETERTRKEISEIISHGKFEL